MAEQISSIIAPETPRNPESQVRPAVETGNTTGVGNAPEKSTARLIPVDSGNSTLIEEEISISKPATLDDVMDVARTQPTVLSGEAGNFANSEKTLLDTLSNR